MNGELPELLNRARQGDSGALNELFSQYRRRLRRMVQLRLNHRLHGRVDPSDVIQDAYVEVSRCLPEYLRQPKIPFFLWLRHITGQKIIAIHRQHLGAQMRDAEREVSLYRGTMPSATSEVLAAQLLGKLTSPSVAAVRAEMKKRLEDALNSMESVDREVLALRHLEQLTNSEAAQELQISESAASKRYVRALERLQRMTSDMQEYFAR